MSMTINSSGLTFSDGTSLTKKLPKILPSVGSAGDVNTLDIDGIPSDANIVWVNIPYLRNPNGNSILFMKFKTNDGSVLGATATYQNSCVSFGTGITESEGVMTTTGGNIFPLLPSNVIDYFWSGSIQMVKELTGHWAITWRLSSTVAGGTAYRTTIGAGKGWIPTGSTLGGIRLGFVTLTDKLYGNWSVSYA